ncbi:MAG TPA: hypothetical protein VJV79_12225 [Polyangiaceae bacterium]|nr:hypothetical protein [Polyangiaceae bacterium]
MFTNRSANEINIRVVFYGPGLVGKTTLMQRIYDTTPESQKGKIVSLQTETERTVFYDLQRPDFPEVEGALLRLHLYTLSGQVFYAASSKLIISPSPYSVSPISPTGWRTYGFTHAITGNLKDSVDVTFIHVVPVLPDELEFATKEGTPALLEKMNLAKRGKDFGWGRKPRESVLRKGFLSGLFT